MFIINLWGKFMLSVEQRLRIWGESLRGGPNYRLSNLDSTRRIQIFSGEKEYLTDEQFTHAVKKLRERQRIDHGKIYFLPKHEHAAYLCLVYRKHKTLAKVSRETATTKKQVRRWCAQVLHQHKINMGFHGQSCATAKETRTGKVVSMSEAIISRQVSKAIAEMEKALHDGELLKRSLYVHYVIGSSQIEGAAQISITIRTHQANLSKARVYLTGFFSNIMAQSETNLIQSIA
jgi:hypothetical protein